MHLETYPAFFTPRDKEPSLSSSEEKSSEFGWLERKKNEKTKAEQVLCILLPSQNCTKDASLGTSSRDPIPIREQAPQDYIHLSKKITNYI